MSTPFPVELPHAGLFRRLAAIVYDAGLLIAALLIASVPTLALSPHGASDGGAPAAFFEGHPLYKAGYLTYLFLVAYWFFAWFWTHGGQTLGMRAWRLRVVTNDGKPIGLWHALLRFLVSIASWGLCGLGFLWSFWDKERLTWHDRYSETVIVVLPKGGKS